MRISALRRVLAYVPAVLLIIAWAIVIWVACHVSTVVLNTLDMIIDLAAISP